MKEINKSTKTNDTGKIIRAVAYSEEGYSDRAVDVLCDNSGMNGDESLYQLHSNELDTMWITVRNPESHNTVWFDLGAGLQISCMMIWNFNQQGNTQAGLRLIRIFTSNDSVSWDEYLSDQSPFVLAQASGEPWIRATNLDDPDHSPVWFNGKTVRYVKLVPDPEIGVGNHGEYIEGQHRYGLSAVRFYLFKPQTEYGVYLPARAYPTDRCAANIEHNNICNGLGLSNETGADALLSNLPEDLWLSELNPVHGEILFDFEGTYPIKEMHLWNYNEKGNTGAGIKNVRIFYGKSRFQWEELKGDGYPYILDRASGETGEKAGNLAGERPGPVKFDGVMARYVKIVLAGGCGTGTWGYYNGFEQRFGIGKVRFYADEGYCVEPNHHFNGLLSNYHGWSGADGIFMAPDDGEECQKSGEQQQNHKTITIFSDTFYGEVDPVTRKRKSFTVLNNSSAEFISNKPEQLNFRIRKDQNGDVCSLITNLASKGCFYWLQDCFIHNKKLYSFTDNIVFDEKGMEGFQFDLIGVDRVSINLVNGSLDFESVETCQTPLYLDNPKTYYGCAILPNSYKAKLPYADGYIYIYGLQDKGLLNKSLLISRVKEEEFENFDAYTFYNGDEFVPDIRAAVSICEEGGAEMSITPITEGEHEGKYLYIYSVSSVGCSISCRIATTPWGPFSDSVLLYDIQEAKEIAKFGGRKIYTYNAKAHYHISTPDELIISFNVNSMDFESHIQNAEIYRPRFLSLKTIKKTELI
ncbi:MAG: discoidin domain-containing protein [Saccharofermentanales bacterium]